MKKAVVAVALMVLMIFVLAAVNADAATKDKKVKITNRQNTAVVASISFADNSQINAQTLGTFCNKGSAHKLNCRFEIPANGSKEIPGTAGKWLNMALAFKSDVGCGSTKAEINVNNPSWFDIVDVSLVDGFNEKIQIEVTPTGGKKTVLGPPAGKTGNERVFGVYPLGCDVCVERRNPPCGQTRGRDGCKSGTEMKPDVVCQYQDNSNTGLIEVILMP